MKGSYEVLGVGAPILDQILPIEEHQLPGAKGGMELVPEATIEKIIASSSNQPLTIAGGSGTNTIKGLANFGHKCAIAGKTGADARGSLLESTLKSQGIVPLYRRSPTHTGHSLCLITPDKERTMRTFPGAAAEMTGADLDPAWFEGVALVHIEGYTLLNENLTERAMTLAQEVGAKISFDLSSFEIATRYKEKIVHLLTHHIHILFANELETRTFTKLDPKRGCLLLKDICETVVVFMGDQGGWVARGSELINYPAFKANPLDTTGAGDLFASGFLHGYLTNRSLTECARLGAQAGSAVVQVMGTEIPPEIWNQIKI